MEEMNDFRPRTRKVQTEPEKACEQKVGKCSSKDGKMSKGHRKELPIAISGKF